MTRWMEIITLRTAGLQERQASLGLLNQVDKRHTSAGQQRFKLYHNANVETDLSIRIDWDSDTGSQRKSLLGAELARALSDFGLVNHNIWIEEKLD